MNFHIYKYHLPLKTPLQTSTKKIEDREGLILEYSAGDFKCYGEGAPLPGYSKEKLEDVQQILTASKKSITKKLDTDNPVELLQDFYPEQELPPSLQFGLDSIAYQVQAYRNGSTLPDFLFPESANPVPVNALESLHSDRFLKGTNEQIQQGFSTIKFKIGVDFKIELERLQAIRSEFPDLTIRLDANQSWTTEEALRHLGKLETLEIEYCEEPLKKATPENYDLLSQHLEIPLALDESISHLSYWPNLLPFTSYIILKPMLLGNFTKNIETKRLANTHNNKAVFTTSLESGVGRRMTAILASGLGSPQTAHGLNTGKLFAKDVHSDLAYISNGAYHLNRHHQPRIDFQVLEDVSSS